MSKLPAPALSSDVVTLATSGTSDTIQSSASYTLSTNVQYLTLSGASALAGTGNNLTDLIVGNSGADTLVGGTGIAVLEGGRTAGSDQIKALSNQAALIGGAAASTLTGGAFKDFYAAGKVSDSITTGATANVVSVNKGDGATTLQPTTSATNVLSLGAGIDTESLFFTKTGNNLILTDGVAGDSITFTNWYVGSADQDYTTLQVVEIASANYNSGGGDGLRNKALEAFNFTALVAAYNTAGSPANWALSTAMPTTQLTTTSTADYGGDLAYYFGLNGNLTGMDLSAAQSTLTNASFGTATQTIDTFSGISGGGGLHLSIAPSPPRTISPIRQPQFLDGENLANSISPERGIQLRQSAALQGANSAAETVDLDDSSIQNLGMTVSASTVSLPAITAVAAVTLNPAANIGSLAPILRLPNEFTPVGELDFATNVPTERVIASGNSPEIRLGGSPAETTAPILVTTQANADASSEFSAAAPTALQALVPDPGDENRIQSSQPEISLDDDLSGTITPRIPFTVRPGIAPATSSIEEPAMSAAMGLASSTDTPSAAGVSTMPTIAESSTGAALSATDSALQRLFSPTHFPQLRDGALPTGASSVATIQPTLATPRIGGTITPVKISDIDSMLASLQLPSTVSPQINVNWPLGLLKNLVDPINIAWLSMHDALDQSSAIPIGGSEAGSDQISSANDALVGALATARTLRVPDDLAMHSQQLHQRAL